MMFLHQLALPLANATPQREREKKEREWLMIVANLILLVKEGAKLLENVDDIMVKESIFCLIHVRTIFSFAQAVSGYLSMF